MGIGCSRRHHHRHRNNDNTEAPQQSPPNYPYNYPMSQHGRARDPAFVPFPPYPAGMQPYGQSQRQLPQPHAHQHGAPPTHGSTNAELYQTKTIRNRVNLKKPTLKMVRTEENRNKLIPRFVFDASAPCSVTVFYMATEESTKKSKLTAIIQEPGPRAMYSTGLGQVFPPKGKEDVYALDLSLYQDGDLTSVSGEATFPLIVRLETVTDASIEGHVLDDLEPGCPTPTWVQSQTTYAYLVREGEEWEPRTVKQKIWVDGVSYELQEIYGIQEFYSPEKKTEEVDTFTEDIEGRECVICLAALRDTTVLPCRHMCLCASCAREIQRQQVSTCPICRDAIDSLLHIKRPAKKNQEPASTTETNSDEPHTSNAEPVKSA